MSYGDFEVSKGFTSGFATSIVDEALEGANGYARGPERSLLSALLFDGIQSYIHCILAPTEKEKARYMEAYHWVMDDSVEYTFSFTNVCEALGVNPGYLRFGLANACHSHLAEVGKSRRNF
jgi:hypothetical protein